MFKINGLDGHIRANQRWSAAIVAGFAASVCVCWMLCFVVYNTTYRYMFGEDVHRGTVASLPLVQLLSGGTSAPPGSGTFVVRSSRSTAAERARIAQQEEDDRIAGKTKPPKPRDFYSLPELAVMGLTSGATSLYVPILFVAGWFVVFWFGNADLVRRATGARPPPEWRLPVTGIPQAGSRGQSCSPYHWRHSWPHQGTRCAAGAFAPDKARAEHRQLESDRWNEMFRNRQRSSGSLHDGRR